MYKRQIDEFYEAINRRDIDRCRALVQQLQDLARTQPALSPWCDYLNAILIGEDQQDWAAAEAIYRRLLQVDQTLEPLLRGRVWLALAINLNSQARWLEAIAACEESLTFFQAIDYLADQPFVWQQIATNYLTGFSYGDLGGAVAEKAILHCQQALAAFGQIADPPPYLHDFRGVIIHTLGVAYSLSMRWEEALPCFQEFLDLATAANDVLRMSIACTYIGDAYLNLPAPHPAEARQKYEQAWQHVANFTGSPIQQTEVLTRLGLFYAQMGDYARALEQYNQAIEIHERLRAGVSAESARAGFFASVVPTYEHKILACVACGDLAEAFNTVEQVRARTLLDHLVEEAPQLERKLAGRLTTLAEVQAALPPDALLVAYYTTGSITVRERTKRATSAMPLRIPPAQTLIFAVSQHEITFYPAALSPNALKPRDAFRLVEEHFLQPHLRRELYRHLLAPLANKLAGKQRLYVIPHGPLHAVPFHALLMPSGETLLHEGGPSLVYAPSCSVLLQMRQRRSRPTVEPCLALGYNGAGDTQLRWAEAEASMVAQLLGGQAWVGTAAKQALLYQTAQRYRILHIACHGAFNAQAPLQSALQIAPAEPLTAAAILDHLQLRCELVVLSACESALTRVQRGDELYGLLRAFMAAGASAMLATLWRVDERATVLLMERFYRGVLAGLAYADALHAAQLFVRSLTRRAAQDTLRQLLGEKVADDADLLPPGSDPQPFADPKDWAAFVLFGDSSLA